MLLFSISGFAQVGPTVEGTYLPVRGTAVKNIWDISYPPYLSIPSPGQNIVWDYSNEFLYPTDTFKIETFHPDSVVNGRCFSQYFPTATHASFLRTPLNNLSDSIYLYYVIDADGLHNLGGFNIKKASNGPILIGYDTTSIITPRELLVPSTVTYGMPVRYDTTRFVTYGKLYGVPVRIKGGKFKEMIPYGYGTLKMPNGGSFNNVILARQNIKMIDTVFQISSNAVVTILRDSFAEYSFIRNNTFGSSYLMYLYANWGNNVVNNGWYSLPVDFGSISGTVYDSLGGIVPHGKALLYRENSNFAKNDILDSCSLSTFGTYLFDSIPYGEYRIAIRADSSYEEYKNAFTTYFGDTTDWLAATPIHTTANSINNNITLRYHPGEPIDGAGIHGHINLDLGIKTNNPIPGVDIVVKKNPGGIPVQEVKTDSSGNFTLNRLEDGNYKLFVDIPGLHMAGTYNIIVISGTIPYVNANELDFTVGTDSIHPNSQFVGIKELYMNDNLLGAYPNPYSSNTLIKINLTEKCDVVLEVYNLLGEKIKTLENGSKIHGSYFYNFSAKNLNFPAGIYIVKLNAGGKTSVLKIIEQ